MQKFTLDNAGKHRSSGFSLIEMSIVLLVLSLVTGGALTVATARIDRAKISTTTQHLDAIEDAIVQFSRVNNRLPCPADGTQAVTVANFGIEAANAGACTGGTPAANAGPAGTLPVKVVMGVAPTKTLQLPDDYQFDGWGGRIDYLVDARVTALDAFTTYPITDQTTGGINIRDKDSTGTNYDITPLAATPTYGAVMALVSHGKNNHGAYGRVGSATRMTASGVGAQELKNCHCDAAGAATALDTILYQHSSVTTSTSTYGNYDDIVRYKMRFQFYNPVADTTTTSAYDGPELVVGSSGSPYLNLYSINHNTDVFSSMSLPTTVPSSNVRDVEFSADTKYMGTLESASLKLYKIQGNQVQYLTGQPDIQPGGTGNVMSFSKDASYVVSVHTPDGSSNSIDIYTRSGDTFTKLAGQPATQPGVNVGGASFSPDTNFLAAATSFSATYHYLMIFQRSGNSFTWISGQPAVPPTGGAYNAQWTSDSKYLAICYNASPYVSVYSRSGTTFTKVNGGDTSEFANSADLPAFDAKDIAFSPDDQYMAVAQSDTPGVVVYKHITANRFSKLGAPTGGAPAAGSVTYGVGFSKDGNYLAIATTGTPYLYIYKRTGDNFAKVGNPSGMPPTAAHSLGFNGN